MLDHENTSTIGTPIAEIHGLRVEFQTKDGPVVGVSDVSFDINSGETVCVVGESGSGKSVSSLSLMRLVEFGGGEITGGRLLFNRKDEDQIDLAQTEPNLMRSIRGNEIGMIFQEPMTALNPVFTVERQLTEGLRLHKGMSKVEASEKGAGADARSAYSRTRASFEAISPRVVRRYAPTCCDRNGAGL